MGDPSGRQEDLLRKTFDNRRPALGCAPRGSSEDLLMRAGEAAPEWTKERRLNSNWFIGDSPAFHEYLALHSPEPFRRRGVMVDPDALESV